MQIRFIGIITDESGAVFLNELDRARMIKGRKKIDIVINTVGGETDVAFGMHDALAHSGLAINTVVEGVCASAGVMILLAGKKRYITAHSSIIIHPPRKVFDGETVVNARDCAFVAERLNRFENLMIELISEKTGQNKRRVKTDMRHEKLFDAKESVRYGFVHKII